MSDRQWAVIEPLLPPPGNTGGRGGRAEKWDRRLILDAIFYVARGGIAWRQLPSDFPPHPTVYWWFRKWTRAGVFTRVYADLRERSRITEGRAPTPTAAVIDSQTVRGADTVSVPRQAAGRFWVSGKLGVIGSARPRCTSRGRFQAIASCGRTVL